MSHPIPTHDRSNEYREDGFKGYPHKRRRAKSEGPLHNVANRLSAKARALQKLIDSK